VTLPSVVTHVNSPGWIVNSQAQASPSHRQPVLSIELHTPVSPVMIPVIRVVAADLAARAGFETDSIDDARMAVDDACAMLVRVAAQGATLSSWFTVRPSEARQSWKLTSRTGRSRCPPDRLDGGYWSASLSRLRPAPCPLSRVSVGGCASPWVNMP
jgi:hypothetical protein